MQRYFIYLVQIKQKTNIWLFLILLSTQKSKYESMTNDNKRTHMIRIIDSQKGMVTENKNICLNC